MLKQTTYKKSGRQLRFISTAVLVSTIFLSATVAHGQADTARIKDRSGYYLGTYSFHHNIVRFVCLHLKNDSTYSLIVFIDRTKKLIHKEKGTWSSADSIISIKSSKKKYFFKNSSLKFKTNYPPCTGEPLVYFLSEKFIEGEFEVGYDYSLYGLPLSFDGKEGEGCQAMMKYFSMDK